MSTSSFVSLLANTTNLTEMVAELVQRPVAVLVTGADPAAVAGKRATATIPIVFAVGGDPIKLALVQSLIRPGVTLPEHLFSQHRLTEAAWAFA